MEDEPVQEGLDLFRQYGDVFVRLSHFGLKYGDKDDEIWYLTELDIWWMIYTPLPNQIELFWFFFQSYFQPVFEIEER